MNGVDKECPLCGVPKIMTKFQSLFVAFIMMSSITSKCHAGVKVYKKAGDFIIGGFVPVHEFDERTRRCSNLRDIGSLRRVEAIAYATVKINNDSSILDGFSLGYEIYDTCSSSTETLKNALRFTPPMRENDDLVGVVGPQRSSSSVQATNLLGLYNISLVSYLSTSDELSNSYRYPYFLRTVPPDKFQVSVITDILVNYNWKYVAFIYSDDTYGKNAEAEFSMQAEEKDICIGYTRSISVTTDEGVYNSTVSDLLELQKNSLVSVVILFIQREMAATFFAHARQGGIERDFIFIGSDGWGNYDLDPVRGSEEAALGAFTVVPKAEPHAEFNTYFTENIYASLNPWVEEYHEKEGESVLLDEDPSPAYESIVIDSVEVLARGLDTMRKELCNNSMNMTSCRKLLLSNRRKLRDHLLDGEFTSSSNGLVAFTDDGDSKGRYDIRYLSETNEDEYRFSNVGSWLDGDKTDLQIGKFSWYLTKEERVNGPTYTADNVPKSVCSDPCEPLEIERRNLQECCWTCDVCEYHEIIGDNQCISCFYENNQTYMLPSENRSYCEPLQTLTLIDEIDKLILLVIASIGLLGVVVVAYLYVRNRDKKLIKASSRDLGYIVLVGIFLSYISAILYSTPPFHVTCILRRIIPNIGTAFIYISLATMTVRLYRIFKSGQKSVKRPSYISPKSQVSLTLILSLIPIIWGIVWIIVEPPDVIVVRPADAEQTYIERRCVVSTSHRIGQLAWDVFVVLICCVFAFLARNLPANYNQTRFIAFSVFCTLVVYIAFAPAFFTSQEDTNQQDLYTALGAILQSTVVLVLIFAARIYAVYFVNEEDQKLITTRPSLRETPGRRVPGSPVKTVSNYVINEGSFRTSNGSISHTVSDFSSQTIEAELSCNCSYKSNGHLSSTRSLNENNDEIETYNNMENLNGTRL